MPISIIVDDREQRSCVMEALEASRKFDIKTRRLAVGDYLVDNRFLFERKTISDLICSIVSGRLFNQAARLATVCELKPVIVLEGTSKNILNSDISWESIQGALITVSVFYGIPVLRTRNVEETARAFLYVSQQMRAVVSGGLSRSGYRPKGREALQNYILQGLPGVGPRRAKELLQRFGSIEAVMSANADELAGINGIGSATAKKIRWAVTEPQGAYALSA